MKRTEWRCPTCLVQIEAEADGLIVDGVLVVCAACATPSRPDGGRLVQLDPGELASESVAAVVAERDRVRRAWPTGHVWKSAALCASCWERWHPDRVPVRVIGVKAEPCELCGEVTSVGIYRRMLVAGSSPVN